jgi:hypothetical protein
MARRESRVAGLFVADGGRGARAVERQDFYLPFDAKRSGRKAGGFVAGLVFELAGQGEEFSFFAERAPEFGASAHLQILADAEVAFEDGNGFFDGGKIERFRLRIDGRFYF